MKIVFGLIAVLLMAGCSAKENEAERVIEEWKSAEVERSILQDAELRVEGTVSGEPELFSLESLMKLPVTTFQSTDPWRGNEPVYEGILLYPFLEKLGLPEGASSVRFVAVNDYEIEVNLGHIKNYGYLLCWSEDGSLYSELPDESNKGPLSIAIDFEKHSDLDVEVFKYHNVWWLDRIFIE